MLLSMFEVNKKESKIIHSKIYKIFWIYYSTKLILINPSENFVNGWRNLATKILAGRSQDGGGIGWGDHSLSYKFIERTIERWTKFTKQLLIASSGHQAPRKAAHCLQREVGQNIKDKKGDKRARDGDPSQEGSLNRGSVPSPGNPRAGGSGGSFQISEGSLTGRKN